MKVEHIAASRVAALWHVHPWWSYWQLWQYHKTGIRPPESTEDERKRWGKLLEPVILQETAQRLSLTITPYDQAARVEGKGLVCITDAEIYCPSRGHGVVEVKTVDGRVYQESWRSQTHGMPLHVELQVQVQLLLHGADWACVPVLVGGNHLELFERHPEPSIIADLLVKVEEFRSKVDNNLEPPLAGTEPEVRHLKEIYPSAEPMKVRSLDTEEEVECVDAAMGWLAGKEYRSDGKDKVAEAEATLLHLIKDAEYMQAQGFEVRRRTSVVKDSRKMVPELNELVMAIEDYHLNGPKSADQLNRIGNALDAARPLCEGIVIRKGGTRSQFEVVEVE